MKLKLTTDYAIRIIGYLYQNGDEISTAKHMSEQLYITYNYIIKVIASIKKAGYIESIQGASGGYRLAKDAYDITLYDIIEAMEGKTLINHCLRGEGCNYYIKNNFNCPAHDALGTIQAELINLLKNKKINEVWAAKKL